MSTATLLHAAPPVQLGDQARERGSQASAECVWGQSGVQRRTHTQHRTPTRSLGVVCAHVGG